jgi:hypothetical protein
MLMPFGHQCLSNMVAPFGSQWLLLTILLGYPVLWIAALVHVLRRQFPEPNAKLIWVLVIVFAQGIGAIIYFVLGRKQGTLHGQPATR